MTKFSDLLEEYLEERDRQNSDYYDTHHSILDNRRHMNNLKKALDEMVQGVEE